MTWSWRLLVSCSIQPMVCLVFPALQDEFYRLPDSSLRRSEMFIDRNLRRTMRGSEGRNETRLVLVKLEFRPSEPRRRISDLRAINRGRERRLVSLPLPPNRTGGSPASGSPVGVHLRED